MKLPYEAGWTIYDLDKRLTTRSLNMTRGDYTGRLERECEIEFILNAEGEGVMDTGIFGLLPFIPKNYNKKIPVSVLTFSQPRTKNKRTILQNSDLGLILYEGEGDHNFQVSRYQTEVKSKGIVPADEISLDTAETIINLYYKYVCSLGRYMNEKTE